MARFLHHEPCPKCGSRDNLGRYDDGGATCFGCGHYEPPTHAPPRVVKRSQEIAEDESSIPQMPDDTGTHYSAEAVAWLAKYHVSVETAIGAGVRWSDSRQQLIFLLEDGCWQARNFDVNQAKKRKYFTAGNVNDSIKLYLSAEPAGKGPLAVVEDCVSAIRIAGSGTDALPVLGSHVSRTKLTRLARLYSSLIVWLDHDKLKEARLLAEQAKMLGLSTRVIYTDDDPKCFTNEQLKEILHD